DHYLGPYGTRASRAEYDCQIAKWIAAGRRTPVDADGPTVVEVAAAFRRHAAAYYRHADGTPTSEPVAFDTALGPLLKLYGRTPAADFGPLALKAVRNEMIRRGWVRTSINKHAARIRHVFKWAVENELVPANALYGLQAVSGLRVGRSDAAESEPVKPVPQVHVDAVLPHVSKQVGALIRLQLLCGARPGELLMLRGSDLDTSGKLWSFSPVQHKTLHRGQGRTIYFGPRSQEIIREFLKPDLQACLFDPRDAEHDRREAMHAARKTPASVGNAPGTNRKRHPQRSAGDRYTVASYRRAIARGCDDADVPRWHPHQLRHSFATSIRRERGLEVAQVALGHASIEASQIYAERNNALAMRLMEQIG
ncbi:MAG: tyrosine-type recombinase/integrase, partial [Tepidisphaeraceae bacterium]